jgi:hypothetical protein
MMTEYAVMDVPRLYRDMPGYQAAQTNREWRRTTIVRPELDPKPPFASINSNAGPCPLSDLARCSTIGRWQFSGDDEAELGGLLYRVQFGAVVAIYSSGTTAAFMSLISQRPLTRIKVSLEFECVAILFDTFST